MELAFPPLKRRIRPRKSNGSVAKILSFATEPSEVPHKPCPCGQPASDIPPILRSVGRHSLLPRLNLTVAAQTRNNDKDTFVGVREKPDCIQLTSFSGNEFDLDIATGSVTFSEFHK